MSRTEKNGGCVWNKLLLVSIRTTSNREKSQQIYIKPLDKPVDNSPGLRKIKNWYRLLREMVKLSSLERVKNGLNKHHQKFHYWWSSTEAENRLGDSSEKGDNVWPGFPGCILFFPPGRCSWRFSVCLRFWHAFLWKHLSKTREGAHLSSEVPVPLHWSQIQSQMTGLVWTPTYWICKVRWDNSHP